MTIQINCLKEVESKFKFVCPKTWGALKATGEEGVRFCDECSKTVYLCSSDEELQNCATKGQCAALKTEANTHIMGEPEAGYGTGTSLNWE